MKRKIILTICLIVSLSTLAEGWFEKVPLIAFGGGITTEFKGEGNHVGYGGDFITMGALVSLSFTRKPEMETCGTEEKRFDVDIVDKVTFHVGYTFPIKNFGNKEHINRLFALPIIEFNCISHYKSEYLHKYTNEHHCQYRVHQGYAEKQKVGYGAALMYQRSMFYSMLKLTTKSANLSIGLAF